MAKRKRICYNVGCGKRNWPGWVHVDGADFPHIESHNITLAEVESGTINLLYSSHLISYLDQKEFANLLECWYKKIKRGGTLRIATPDFNALKNVYILTSDFSKIAGPLYGRMAMNEGLIYHKYCYDYDTLSFMLMDAGFKNIQLYDHRKTKEHPNTGDFNDPFDDCSAAYINGTLVSLNIQAKKPL